MRWASPATESRVVWLTRILAARNDDRGGDRVLKMRLNPGAYEFVKMDHAVFHGRLVGAEFVAMLLMERAATLRHAHADFFIFPGGFGIGVLLRLDELALEQHDVFGVIEFDDVRAMLRIFRQDCADDEDVGIPFDHYIRVIGQPDRALLRHFAIVVTQYRFVPFLIDRKSVV